MVDSQETEVCCYAATNAFDGECQYDVGNALVQRVARAAA